MQKVMRKCLQSSVQAIACNFAESLPMLIQLLYSSKATTALSPAELTAILDKSVANNQARQITGLLLYRDGCFLQLLEGEAAVVEEAFRRISLDPRHHQVESLFCSECKQRSLPVVYGFPCAAA
jgi:hypothetical protein